MPTITGERPRHHRVRRIVVALILAGVAIGLLRLLPEDASSPELTAARDETGGASPGLRGAVPPCHGPAYQVHP